MAWLSSATLPAAHDSAQFQPTSLGFAMMQPEEERLATVYLETVSTDFFAKAFCPVAILSTPHQHNPEIIDQKSMDREMEKYRPTDRPTDRHILQNRSAFRLILLGLSLLYGVGFPLNSAS